VTSSPARAEAKARPDSLARFVARQPILTKDEKVFGYELLFRDGVENYFCPPDAEAASRSTLESSMLLGLDVLCDGQRAFMNCTREMLLKDYVTLLPPNNTVVEVLESVPARRSGDSRLSSPERSRVHGGVG
jgi:c-di-GMP-related signal transduction protein